MKIKKQINPLVRYFFSLFLIFLLLLMIVTSNSKNISVINNVNTLKSVESSRISSVAEKVITVFSIEELQTNKNKAIEFTGTITAYGPDCVGCSGIVGCYPYQDVRNGNIYYKDSSYGTIRILAADPSIPCGSIVKISNYFQQEIIGIVLDRGSDIKGLTMDLLANSEQETISVGRQYNINFKIERWGF